MHKFPVTPHGGSLYAQAENALDAGSAVLAEVVVFRASRPLTTRRRNLRTVFLKYEKTLLRWHMMMMLFKPFLAIGIACFRLIVCGQFVFPAHPSA